MANTPIEQQIQKLEAGKKVHLIEVDCSSFGGEILRFHNYNVDYTPAELAAFQAQGVDEIPPKPIIWQGNTYSAWPYSMDGIEWDGQGQSPQPSLEVANIDGTISAMCLELENLFGAKVTQHTTFRQYLPDGDDPDPTMEFKQIWFISRKSGENQSSVSFELSSPADFAGQRVPRRLIHSVCHWALNGGYRGPDCGYTGTLYFTDEDKPTTNPVEDVCAGLKKSCVARQGKTNPITFGGFIGSSMIG